LLESFDSVVFEMFSIGSINQLCLNHEETSDSVCEERVVEAGYNQLSNFD
jgi:hypothetical protein